MMMEDPSSLFSEEDDGSLRILCKITSENSDCSTFTLLNMDEESESTITSNGASLSPPPTMLDGICNKNNSLTDSSTDSSQPTGLNDVFVDEEDLGILSLWEIDKIVKKEKENLQLVQMANDMMRNLMSKKSTTCQPKQTRDASVNTTDFELPAAVEEPIMTNQQDPVENEHVKTPVEPAARPYQKLLRRFSSNFHRRRQANKPNRNNQPTNVQNFVQDYYRSLDSVSRYIMAASILSFVTAFVLLSWYGAQTHSQDMELFQLKENRVLANQHAFQQLQLQNENFRESMIHQRYEETRECQSSLELCHSKRDELLDQISKIEMDTGKDQTKLETSLAAQRKNIQTLEAKIRELQEQNRELRKEIGKSFSSSYAQILLSFLNIAMNRSVQIAFGTFVTIAILFIIVGTSLSK